ncbi:MAG: nucleoside recognition domain-containing protein [Verrucomicrobiota bacterium]
MLNYIWLGLVLLAVIIGGSNGTLPQVTKSGFEMAKTAVLEIALPLSAVMTIWLGIMRLAEKSGLVLILARAMRPVMRWLFPEVPPEHPANGAMLMNIAANMLGLNNAATPLGLRAMTHLEKLNPHPGTATNAMCMFLTINTSSVQLIPATAVGLMAAAGSKDSTAIVGTAFLATLCSTAVGVFFAKLFARWWGREPATPVMATTSNLAATAEEAALDVYVEPPKISPGGKFILALFFLLIGYFCAAIFKPGWRLQNLFPQFFSDWNILVSPPPDSDKPLVNFTTGISILAIPFFLAFFPLYAALRRVKVYEEFIEGAKEGFQVAIRIIPYLVAILTAVGMFRGAGGIALLTKLLKPALDVILFPTELLPLVLMRPLSGSGSIALVSDLIKNFGPDHLLSRMGATILGSTETTFYVIAVYFGSVGIRRTRYAVAAGLLADLAGVIAAIVICRIMFG